MYLRAFLIFKIVLPNFSGLSDTFLFMRREAVQFAGHQRKKPEASFRRFGLSRNRDNAVPRYPRAASFKVKCLVSGAHAIDTIIPTNKTNASAIMVA